VTEHGSAAREDADEVGDNQRSDKRGNKSLQGV
jgi:hypothetical protein